MYLYVNEDADAVGFMPSNRGRMAANHYNREDIEVSVSVVPNELISAEGTTAKKLKDWVIENGSVSDSDDVPTHEVAYGVLVAMTDTLAGPMWEKQRNVLQGLVDEFNDEEGSPGSDWVGRATSAINLNKRAVNSIMNERKYGWFINGHPKAIAAAEKAAEMSFGTPVEGGDYGFARMTKEAPKLGVVSAEAEKEKDEEHGVFYPKADATYIINPQIERLFGILETSSKKCPQNVNLIGPHGCGKTELAIQFAARHDRPLLIMDCANLREARDWFGYKSAREGTVFWHESQFVRAVQNGNHVILLDELNRANPNLLNTLMPILDARRFTYLEEKGNKIIVGPGTVFFASMNEGAGYTGTSALDRAIRDRFPRAVELTYLAENDEVKLLVNRTGVTKDIASRLVQMANKIRQDSTGLSATLTESLSTRQLIAAAHDFVLGGVDTLQFTITNHFSPEGDDDSERVKVQSIIQGKFGDLIAAQAAATSKGA
jgi:Holliday junction resolvasome RuvABC ATP-dependent DNA helicase subunit